MGAHATIELMGKSEGVQKMTCVECDDYEQDKRGFKEVRRGWLVK